MKVERHPQADHLYVEEEIDLGEEKPRQVVSGLAKHVPLEAMRDRLLVVVCNMKPANFRGVRSEAMVLAANSADGATVELVDPPSLSSRASASSRPVSTERQMTSSTRSRRSSRPSSLTCALTPRRFVPLLPPPGPAHDEAGRVFPWRPPADRQGRLHRLQPRRRPARIDPYLTDI